MVNFDSREEFYKSPFGAVKSGEKVRLRLKLTADCGALGASLVIKEDREENFRKIPMNLIGSDDEFIYYTTEITLEKGLYWYHFCFEKSDCDVYITKGKSSGGYFGGEGGSWQITVYEESSRPEWLPGGIIYQIFPDRFCFSGEKKKNIPSKRYIRTDWGEEPEFRQEVGNPRTLGNDFFCGDLKGIESKLPYLEELGVSVIYLNPIFEASSNHRYNTGDYEKIDPMLGNEKDFVSLCKKAKRRGIRIILDGVFSHTGDDSRYFDRYGEFGIGACVSEDSPYRHWFKFKVWPHDYHSWWGVDTLPEVEETDDSYIEYICGEKGILKKWLRLGASGWRLDVADELPDKFLDALRTSVKTEKSDAYILGEVWEDASNKISYNERRRYLLGDQLDSVMNYPFASAIIEFAKGGSAETLQECVMTVLENYPKPAIDTLMNHIGTHDTARILTILGSDYIPSSRSEQSGKVLHENERNLAIQRLKIAVLLQYTLPGNPSVYYGDEAGLEGYGDPFCRGCYPWGKEDHNILEFYKKLGKIRRGNSAFKGGSFEIQRADKNLFVFTRGEGVLVAVNSGEDWQTVLLPEKFKKAKALLGEEVIDGKIQLPPKGFAVIK